MKASLVSLLLASLLSMSTAFDLYTMMEDMRRERQLSENGEDVTADTVAHRERVLGNKGKGKGKGGSKGSKGSKGKGKGKGAPPPRVEPPEESCDIDCTTLTYFITRETFVPARFENAIGRGVSSAPIFDSPTKHGKQIGVRSDVLTDLGEDAEDCIITTVYSFGPPVDGFYPSTLNLDYSCLSATNSIVGGSGDYGCAGGYEELIEINEDYAELRSTVCGCLCPPEEH